MTWKIEYGTPSTQPNFRNLPTWFSNGYYSHMKSKDLCHDNRIESTQFCEVGSPLALNLIRVASKVTEQIGIIELDFLKRSLDGAFEALRAHWVTCPKCLEEGKFWNAVQVN